MYGKASRKIAVAAVLEISWGVFMTSVANRFQLAIN